MAERDDSSSQQHTVFFGQVDVDEHDVGMQIRHPLDRFGAIGGHAGDVNSFSVEQMASSLKELRIVVDNQEAESHSDQHFRCRRSPH